MSRFGPEAVFGRALRFGEMHRIMVAEGVAGIYRDYRAAKASPTGLSAWVSENQNDFDMVIDLLRETYAANSA